MQTWQNDVNGPWVLELSPAPEAVDVFLRLCRRPHCIFFDSARRDPVLGRYSFVTADPWDFLRLMPEEPDPLSELARSGIRKNSDASGDLPDRSGIRKNSDTTAGGRNSCEFRYEAALPPFQGGVAGLFSYDLGRSLERLPPPRCDEFQLPALAVGWYDVVAAFDHVQGRAWLISQGWPETDPDRRRRRALDRLEQFRRWLAEPAVVATWKTDDPQLALPGSSLAPQFPVPGPAGLTSNFSEADYLAAAARTIEYIRAGDVFQVNLSQRLLYPAVDDAVSLYLRLRERNPAPFAGYFDLGDFQIVSASPERFLQVREGEVEARPIKGTRQRLFRPESDLFSGDELQASDKDRAENVMIVDLLRNDLSRVCTPESVRVTQLCQVETYQYVQHLVSAVRGKLRVSCGPLELLRAAFPGGSITGAPEVRAMEIIAELEPTARGPYCGSLGYLGAGGTFDSSILIRTVTAGRGWWQAPVGGGIVAQSSPKAEYEETWHKAAGLLKAFQKW